MEELLEKVKSFAQQAHGDQRRKFEDEPYIIHLERVMHLTKEYISDMEVLSAALLHDVLEDTSTSEQELENFLVPLVGKEKAMDTIRLVVELTDVFTKKQYPQWNRRKRKTKEAERLGAVSSAAQTIKYADIIDNSLTITDSADDFARVYLLEGKALLKAMKDGDETLRQKAIETVEECLKQTS